MNELFWQTIARYNATTWPVQLAILAAGILLTVLLYRRPSRATKLAMKLYLVFVNGWIAVAYYLVACRERAYSGVMAFFWGVMALIWLYDLAVGYTTFERTRRHDRLVWFFFAVPFCYPLLSLLRGLEFPALTSPVMPCSVAVFTIGLMLAFSERVNIVLAMFLCHWALIGLSKVYFFGIPEDLLLACALLPALYRFLREYIDTHVHGDSKPDVRVMNGLLLVMCAALGLFFAVTLWRQVAGMLG